MLHPELVNIHVGSSEGQKVKKQGGIGEREQTIEKVLVRNAVDNATIWCGPEPKLLGLKL